ncbi:MAG: DUF2933 domain-containing protein [Acidimicrobiales bacterium]
MNRKVLVSLALVGVGIYLFAPGLIGAAVPLLVVLACPLSMVFMMRGMSGGSRCETGTGTRRTRVSGSSMTESSPGCAPRSISCARS